MSRVANARRVGQCLLTLLLFCSLPTCAAVQDYRIASWNLQGASASSESKWNISVRQLIDGRPGSVDILALQEAGQAPDSAELTPRQFPQAGGIPIAEYIWNLGSRSRVNNRYIYFSRVDVRANRVNLAIITRDRVDEVLVLPAPTPFSRPIVGVRIGNDYFFSIHALANGGTDSGVLVQTVHARFAAMLNVRATAAQARQAQWMIMGDFNRTPAALDQLLRSNYPVVYNDVRLISQGTPTQASGGNLDYAILGQLGGLQANLAGVLFLAQLAGFLASDHAPVLFFAPR
jgi:cytolethal distending toxin subunit B